MSLCRATSLALASCLSRTPAAASRLKQRAPPRQMSSGSVPGSSGDRMMIYLLAGVAAFGGLFYAYRVVNSSQSKFIKHTNILHERAEGQKNNPWSRKEGGGEETDEVTEAEAEEEADRTAAVEPAAQDESAGPTAQDVTSRVSAEAKGENDLLAPEVSHAMEEAQQEAATNSEAAANLELAANSEAAAVEEEQHGPLSNSSHELLTTGRKATSSTWSDTQA
ncbi:protein MGARP isoform X2 [Parus major]|uniref:protein MGARP isoform X2 n=1 Tax=Parus major TaxID=9157 RepID=UPI001443BB56|nr:protein MGARP isoform X2 [Parus major]